MEGSSSRGHPRRPTARRSARRLIAATAILDRGRIRPLSAVGSFVSSLKVLRPACKVLASRRYKSWLVDDTSGTMCLRVFWKGGRGKWTI
ncbi:hypothetical protein SGPA1_50032 [Streptomyces misionensis JCM 4497]